MIGSDEITPDKMTEQPDRIEYSIMWFTTGYQPTKKGVKYIDTKQYLNIVILISHIRIELSNHNI